jgi:hypothetical protein
VILATARVTQTIRSTPEGWRINERRIETGKGSG